MTLGATITAPDLLGASDRDRILEAMASCCGERGYAAVDIADIVSRAGVTRLSFESHFATKEDCAAAAFNKLVSETMLTLSSVRSDAVGKDRAVLEVKALLELVAARPDFVRLGLIEARQGATPEMHRAYESAAKVLALMMERARFGGGGEAPAAGLVRSTLGGIEAVLRRELAAGRAHSAPRLLQDFVYAALVPFVGQREALRQSRAAARCNEEG